MRKHLSLVGAFAVAVGLNALVSGTARADILTSTAPPIITANPNGTFTWTYEILVTNTQSVRPLAANPMQGVVNSFTFYDFQGYVAGSAVSSSGLFSASSALVSPAPVTTPFGSIFPNDNAAVPNITFTYTGNQVIQGTNNMGVSLGTFSLTSTLGGPGVRQAFVGRGTDNESSLINANVTNYIAPVPEPGEYAVAGIFAAGLVGLMVRARRRTAREGGMAPA